MTKILYHRGCPDGFTAAWLVAKCVDDPVLVDVAYGEPFPDPYPDDRGEDIYIVDFSYPPETIFAACEAMEGMVHLWDHHKTAIDQWRGVETLPGNLDLYLDATLSGAGIAYEMLIRDPGPRGWQSSQVYDFVSRVQDRDLWRFAYPDTAAVYAAITSRPYTIEAWNDMVFDIGLEALAAEGVAIERYRTRLVDSALRRVRCIILNGQPVPIANAPYEVGSDVASALLNVYPKARFAAYWFDGGDEIAVGLRSTDDRSDVARVAEQYGGGGHRNAAAFRVGSLFTLANAFVDAGHLDDLR